MDRRSGSTELANLRAQWRRWTAIVEVFARRRRGRGRVSPETYRTLHGELTRCCRSLAESADEPGRVFCRTLECLVQPWLDPGVLAKADREILDDLLARCRRAERELGERARDPAAWRRCGLLLTVSAVMAGFLVMVLGIDPGWSPALGSVQGWPEWIWSALGTSHGTARPFLWSIFVTLTSLAILPRITRR